MSPRHALPRLQPDRLRQLAFFREFTPREIGRLLAAGAPRTYDDGELLATEGTRKQRRVLYVVLTGELHYVKRIRAGCAGVVMVLRPGEVGGFLTFLNDDPSPVSVQSVGRTSVFEIGRREMQALGAEEAALAVKLLRTLLGSTARRLETLLDRVAATSAWALDLERHLRALPLLPEKGDGGQALPTIAADAEPRPPGQEDLLRVAFDTRTAWRRQLWRAVAGDMTLESSDLTVR